MITALNYFIFNSAATIQLLYFSEVSDLDTGLLLEVWEKGMLWDRAIGYHWCPLTNIPFTQV